MRGRFDELIGPASGPRGRNGNGGAGLVGIDPGKIRKAREILGTLSDVEAIEVALDLLVLDDAHAFEWTMSGTEDP